MAQDKSSIPDLAQLKQMAARFVPTPIRGDQTGLSAGDKGALSKLIEAGGIVNRLFMQQMWSRNLGTYQSLQPDKSALGQARLHYFLINKGPWSEIDDHRAFVPGVPSRKPPGANFYPEDMTKAEFETWVKTLRSDQKEQAEGFFTVIRRGADRKLTIVPYSQEYKSYLDQLAGLLREAADLTGNASLKKFLTTRAAAFASNNYYDSDIAWMDLDAPLDITIGPNYRAVTLWSPKDRPFICIEPTAGIINALNLAARGLYKDLQSVAPRGTWRERFWIKAGGF